MVQSSSKPDGFMHGFDKYEGGNNSSAYAKAEEKKRSAQRVQEVPSSEDGFFGN